MPVEVQPPELARLIDFAERPRVAGWSLRAALTRYAQPEPVRVSAVLDLVRRIEFALGPHMNDIAADGEALWDAVEAAARDGNEPGDYVTGVLCAAADLDRLGDELAAWAVDRAGPRPDDDVDRVARDVARRLGALGVPQEERPRPPRGRG